MNKALIISCEHAGNTIPPDYEYLFRGNTEVLETHRGYDIGALQLARSIRCNMDTSFFYTEISRLLIEVNRSVGHPQLFSEFSENLSHEEKEVLLNRYYYSYRDQIERAIRWHTANGQQVYHLSIHTFTPQLRGEKRVADAGILFDPERPAEAAFSARLKTTLQQDDHGLVVMDNYPYLGTDDGLTTSLRSRFSDREYCGIEIEVNQKFAQSAEKNVWSNVVAFISQSVCETVRNFVHPGLINVGRVA